MSLRTLLSHCMLLGAVLAIMSGCTRVDSDKTLALTPDAVAIELRESKLAALNNFTVSGGLGIWTTEESISARMTWSQNTKRLDLSLSGPLGLGHLRLSEEDGKATLLRGDNVIAMGPSVDTVLQSGLGLSAPVPMDQLKQWVRGLPGRAHSVVRDDQGKLASLRYVDAQGTRWEARFKRYSILNELLVPALITASGGQYSVRLLLKNWQLASTSVVPETNESNNRLPIPGR